MNNNFSRLGNSSQAKTRTLINRSARRAIHLMWPGISLRPMKSERNRMYRRWCNQLCQLMLVDQDFEKSFDPPKDYILTWMDTD